MEFVTDVSNRGASASDIESPVDNVPPSMLQGYHTIVMRRTGPQLSIPTATSRLTAMGLTIDYQRLVTMLTKPGVNWSGLASAFVTDVSERGASASDIESPVDNAPPSMPQGYHTIVMRRTGPQFSIPTATSRLTVRELTIDYRRPVTMLSVTRGRRDPSCLAQ